MSADPEYDAAIDEIRAKANKVQTAMAKVRGTGTAGNGAISATVDAAGHLRDLKLPRDAHRLGDRLASLILEAAANAERDAAAKSAAAALPLTEDSRVMKGLKSVRETFGQPARPVTPLTDAEVEAADDAYFARLNGAAVYDQN
ncbi:YbaB/EbfC family nucleoid-associated protein [Nocardia fluminea]|uniref:YbaB/EbfC family nucleoid-associated protein n=1 Tax=Nocardia fluminea TaxID=134984 RepID=UPI0033E209C7